MQNFKFDGGTLPINRKLRILGIVLGILALLIPIALSAGSGGGGSSKTSCPNDVWKCTMWSECQKDETQARTCTLDYDCSGVDTPKPAETESCAYVSNIVSSLKCHNLGAIKERVACRLSLSDADLNNELEIAYLPEECRAMGKDKDREECVLLYSASQKCWKQQIGSKRTECLNQLLEIKDFRKEKESCSNPSCFAQLKKKAYALIKFNFYDLEERAEKLYEEGKISKEKAADIISKLEEKKIEFNKAAGKQERKNIINEAKKLWNDFTQELRKSK